MAEMGHFSSVRLHFISQVSALSTLDTATHQSSCGCHLIILFTTQMEILKTCCCMREKI